MSAMTQQWEQPRPASTDEPTNAELAAVEPAGYEPKPYRPAPGLDPATRDVAPTSAQFSPADRRRRRTVVIGSLLAGLAITGAGIGGIVHGATAMDRHKVELGSQPVVVALRAGDERAVYVTDAPKETVACHVNGPAGSLVPTQDGGFTAQSGSRIREEVVSFKAPRDGDYTVTCTPSPAAGTPAIHVADAVGASFSLGIVASILGLLFAIGAPILTALLIRPRRTSSTNLDESVDV